MITNHHYLLVIIFALLLTIILFGIGRIVIKMSFGKLSEDKAKLTEENIKKLSWQMYLPQIILLIILFTLGIYIPENLSSLIFAFIETLTKG